MTYRRGIGNFVYHVINSIAGSSVPYKFFLYVQDSSAAQLAPEDARFEIRVLGRRPYPIWEQISLPAAAARDRLTILHCPANTGPLVLPKRIKLVLTIHDVMFLFPSTMLPHAGSAYQRIGRLYRRRVVPPVAKRAEAIVTVSRSSRRDIVKYLSVAEDKVQVIWEAPDPTYSHASDWQAVLDTSHKYDLRSPFFLALAATDPRKNTGRIIEAFAGFRRRVNDRHQLALVGLTQDGKARFRKLARSLGVHEDVVTAGFVSAADLMHLYNAAEALVYPSLYEGFGLPVLDAMACGTPVITSPRGSLPEVAGNAALLVNPLDSNAIADALCLLTEDPRVRNDLIMKGSIRVQDFSWDRAASQILTVYESVLG